MREWCRCELHRKVERIELVRAEERRSGAPSFLTAAASVTAFDDGGGPALHGGGAFGAIPAGYSHLAERGNRFLRSAGTNTTGHCIPFA